MRTNDLLAARAAAGDSAAAADLIRSVWPDAFRIAWSLLDDRAAAEDAAQEACARAWGAVTRLRRPERFAVWFYRIVVNECRRIGSARGREIAALTEVSQPRSAVPEESIDVRRAIASLEPRLRAAVVLRYYYQLRSTEIAEVVRAAPVTVRWRLMLAHRRLRNLLDDAATVSSSRRCSEERFKDESIAASPAFAPRRNRLC